MAGMKAHRFVGLDKDVWLPDDIKVSIKIISSTRFRSFQKFTGQTKTTWHDTGNPNTRAAGEWTWANNGRPGGSVGGYNFIFDDNEIIQAAPLNETTWAAGTPEGNRVSWHAEQAWGGNTNFDRSVKIGAALHGGLCAAMGWDVATALVQHNVWYGKNCPGQIRKRGTWPKVVNMAQEAATLARLAASGSSIPPKPSEPEGWPYPKPAAPAFWAQLMDGRGYVVDNDTRWYRANVLYEVIAETPRQQYAIADDRIVGPPLIKGTQFRGQAIGQSPNDGEEYTITDSFTRVNLDALKVIDDEAEAA